MDRALVLRALGNLLSNAIRHAPAGSVVNGCRLSASTAGGCVLAVADEGPGLDAAAMQRLIQSREGLVPAAGQGVGFGLLFVQRVAQRHRRRIGRAGRRQRARLRVRADARRCIRESLIADPALP
jgi:signal transduction histidine kinase